MNIGWQQLSVEGFASFQRLMGLKVHKVCGMHWGEAKPCFFRPLLFWRPHVSAPTHIPFKSRIGGYQVPLTKPINANSWFNWFVYDEVRSYTPSCLDKNPRRQLRIAQSNFEVRRITDLQVFKKDASRVYRSFHSRTGYRTGSYRKDPEAFAGWAERLFDIPEILVLGGYRKDQLGGVALSMLLEDTVYYASVFCDDDSLKLSLYDLFWHTLRETAATDNRVQRLFMGSYLNNPGLDSFKFRRGAKLLRQPALLQINPVAHTIVRAKRNWPDIPG
jgi:hypothetical protein